MKYRLWVRLLETEDFVRPPYDGIEYIIPFWQRDRFDSEDGFYVALPEVLREPVGPVLKIVSEAEADNRVKGVLAFNIDELMMLKEAGFSKEIISGPGVYAFNNAGRDLILEYADRFLFPYELSLKELREVNGEKSILNVYGRTPLMITANCVRKTQNACIKGTGGSFGVLSDRKKMDFPVLFQCDSCYNIIYNALPTSLHEYLSDRIDFTEDIMLSFTDESGETVREIIDFYVDLLSGKDTGCPIKDFTKAYFNHGVD